MKQTNKQTNYICLQTTSVFFLKHDLFSPLPHPSPTKRKLETITTFKIIVATGETFPVVNQMLKLF